MFKPMVKQVLAYLFALTLLIGGGMLLTHVAVGSPDSQPGQTPSVSISADNAQMQTPILANDTATQNQDDDALEADEDPDNDDVQEEDGPQDGPDDGEAED